MMIYREIVHTCSNSNVARAAVDSIGGTLARRLAHEAAKNAMSPGAWAARQVREFAESADEIEWRRVVEAANGSDHPVLSGLAYILERALNGATPPAWMIAAGRAN